MRVVRRSGSSVATVRVGAFTALAVATVAALPATAGAALVETHVASPAVVVPHATTPAAVPSPAPAPQNFGPASGSAPRRPASAPAGAGSRQSGIAGGSRSGSSSGPTEGPGPEPYPGGPPKGSDPTCDNDCRAIWADYAWDQFVARWTESLVIGFTPESLRRAAKAAKEAEAWINAVHEIEVEIREAEKRGERAPRTADSGNQEGDGDAVASTDPTDDEQAADSPSDSSGELVASADLGDVCPDPNSREVAELIVRGGFYSCY